MMRFWYVLAYSNDLADESVELGSSNFYFLILLIFLLN